MDFKPVEFNYDASKYFGKTFMSEEQISKTLTLVLDGGTSTWALVIMAIKMAIIGLLAWLWWKQQDNQLTIDRQNFYANLHNTHKDELE